MKKKLKYIILIIFLLFLLFKIVNWVGILRLERIGFSSNEPSLKSESFIFTTNLIKPKKLDFILYDPNHYKAKGYWVHRLCGVENDTIQIINGILYVNNQNIDKKLNLKHFYAIKIEEFHHIKDKIISKKGELYKKDSLIFIQLMDKKSIKFQNIKRVIHGIDDEIKEKFLHKWSRDNFGPVIVPKGFVFVLGDNRHSCIDSRYLGFIPVKNIKGTVILK